MTSEPGYASAVLRRREIERLVYDNLRIPKREARRWLHIPIEQEDLIADGSVGLVRAAQRYDRSKGTPFPAFALPYVRGAILETIRIRARKGANPDGGFVHVLSLDERSEDGQRLLHEAVDPRARTDEIAEELDQIRLLDGLPARERYALVRTEIDGASAKSVGEELGVSTERIYILAAHGATRLRKRAA